MDVFEWIEKHGIKRLVIEPNDLFFVFADSPTSEEMVPAEFVKGAEIITDLENVLNVNLSKDPG